MDWNEWMNMMVVMMMSLAKWDLSGCFFQVCYEIQKQNGTEEAKSCSLFQAKKY